MGKHPGPNGVELLSGSHTFVDDLSMSDVIFNRDEKLVAILGGSGVPLNPIYYQSAMEFAKLISSAGISVITGGGPGIMQAGNKGSKIANSTALSYGLKVSRIKDEINGENSYSVRPLTLIGSSNAVVFFPEVWKLLMSYFRYLLE